MRNLFLRLLIVVIVSSACVSFAPAQRVKGKNLTAVKIYLGTETEEFDERNPHGLVAVKRMVDAKSPLRGALKALADGETRAEKRRELFSVMFGIKFVSVRLENGTAHAFFTMPEGAAFSGDLSPLVFKDAVERTALQFSAVKKVVVCLDGMLDFWSEDDTAPPKKCE
jgi:hypothetical protein